MKYTVIVNFGCSTMLMRAEEMENGKKTKLTIIYPEVIGVQDGIYLSSIDAPIIVFGGLGGFEIVEFEDDEAAILWYRLNN
jgi:hypothetical protein